MNSRPFVVASNREECWFQYKDTLKVLPFDEMNEKNVLMADPFPVSWYETVDDAIKALKLEYRGTAEWAGRTCHRICSWQSQIVDMGDDRHVWGLVQWWIDTESLRPVAVETFGTDSRHVHEFSYRHLNEPIAESLFETPSGEEITRAEPEPLGSGYDRTFLNARDGSTGQMSVRWGKKGSNGTSSSGLN